MVPRTAAKQRIFATEWGRLGHAPSLAFFASLLADIFPASVSLFVRRPGCGISIVYIHVYIIQVHMYVRTKSSMVGYACVSPKSFRCVPESYNAEYFVVASFVWIFLRLGKDR